MEQHQAARSGDFNRVKQLVTNINKEHRDEFRRTVLHYACMGGHDCIVTWLLQMDVNKNACDDYGDTPLHWAVASDNLQCVQLLVDAGVDVSVTDSADRIPLHFGYRSAECTTLLLTVYPNGVIAMDKYKQTALHRAVQYESLSVCFVLLIAGSVIDAVNINGFTPLSYALLYPLRNISELLLDWGARLELVKLDGGLKAIPQWAISFVARRNACKKISKVTTLLRIPGVDPHLFKMLGKYVWNTRKNTEWGK